MPNEANAPVNAERTVDEILNIKPRRGGRPRKPTPPPKPPKEEKDKFDHKAYHKKYYREKLKGEMYCQYCDKCLGSVQSVAKHENRNLQCKLKRMQHIINESNIKT